MIETRDLRDKVTDSGWERKHGNDPHERTKAILIGIALVVGIIAVIVVVLLTT